MRNNNHTAHGVTFLALSTRIEGQGQHLDYVEHLEVPARVGGDPATKVRVWIHDDYADQAYAHAEVWDGHRWHVAVSISGYAFTLEHGVGYRLKDGTMRPEDHAALLADRARLLDLLTEVLG